MKVNELRFNNLAEGVDASLEGRRSAAGSTITDTAESPLRANVDAWIASVRLTGVVFRMSSPNKLTAQPWARLSDADRAFLRANREEIKVRVRVGLPGLSIPSRPIAVVKTEPEPEVYAYGHRITEADVLDALRCLGDEPLDDYRASRMSKVTAYGIARQREQQLCEWGIRKPERRP